MTQQRLSVREASRNRAHMRRLWEENASLGVAYFSLFCYLVFRSFDSHNSLLAGMAAVVLPVSAFFSVRTLFRLLDRFLPAVSWWLRGTVRWTSWWMAHVLILLLVTGMCLPCVPGLFVIVIGLPVFMLIKQAAYDYTVARGEFGSIANAGRAWRDENSERSACAV